MSDFQLALLALGVVVIGGVMGYNALQERRARRRAEKAFGAEPPDVLLSSEGARQEPTLGTLPESDSEPEPNAGRPLAHEPRESEAGLGPEAVVSNLIDTVAVILADNPVPRERLDAMLDALQSHTTPVHVEGIVGEQWWPVESVARAGWRELRAGLQLASRSGPVTQDEIAAFNQTIADFAASVSAVSQREAPDAAAARARELDRFCVDADIEVAVNVVGQFGATFSLARVNALALEHGLSATASGDLVSHGADGTARFAIRRFDREGARHEASYATGLTFALDLPHLADPAATFSAMVRLAQTYCATLGGELVDDHRKPLTDAGLATIRRQLEEVVRKMEAQGIPAGGALARRLFA